MINRDKLRALKQNECDTLVEKVHLLIPRLEEIAQEIRILSIQRIRTSMMKQDKSAGEEIDQQVYQLMEEKRLLLKEHGLDHSIYQPKWNCVQCEDRGYIQPGVLCHCYQQEKLDASFGRSGIPEAMRQYQFENFYIKYYMDEQGMHQKIQRCKEFVEQLAQGSQTQNLVFLGEVGRGKTHLSIAIANRALSKGCTVIYKRMDALLDLIREYKFDRENNDHGQPFELEQLKCCDLLVIDDLGAETVTSFAINQIRIVIEERNMREKPWIINTNLSLNGIEKVYGARVADRIIEKAVFFDFVTKGNQSIRMMMRNYTKEN